MRHFVRAELSMCDKNGGASFWMNLESYKAILQKMETDSDRSMSGEMGVLR